MSHSNGCLEMKPGPLEELRELLTVEPSLLYLSSPLLHVKDKKMEAPGAKTAWPRTIVGAAVEAQALTWTRTTLLGQCDHHYASGRVNVSRKHGSNAWQNERGNMLVHRKKREKLLKYAQPNLLMWFGHLLLQMKMIKFRNPNQVFTK